MFALIDCDNFYAACEEVFDLSLKNKALVILSNNDGCVIARSKEAKKLKIKMGQPVFEIKDLIKTKIIEVRSANFVLYADMSYRVMQTLSQFGNNMELYSIDEVFMKLPDKVDLKNLANQIRQKVSMWTSLPISIGIGPTKTLAKIAAKLAKTTDGIFILNKPSEIDNILAKTRLEDIWGINIRFSKHLQKASIFSALDLKKKDSIIIRNILGVIGQRINLELNSISSLSLEDLPSSKKSISTSRSFGNPIQKLSDLEIAVSSFISKAAEKLRKEKKLTSFLTIFISTSPFDKNYYSNSSKVSLYIPTSYTPNLIKHAKKALREIYQPGFSYKKAGVILSDFSDQKIKQENLFEIDFPQKEKLMQIIDKVNTAHNKKALFFLAEGISKKWQSIQTKISPRYTTRWEDILKVK